MAKATILDRLAGAMETLGKREGKALTPRQRVAAAQRFNELGSIGQSELASMAMDDPRYPEIHRRLNKMGLINNEEELQDNPFLSNNIDKYEEQSDFLDWCRYNRVEPNARNLKQFRWETYRTLPLREQRWIANKDAIRHGVQDEGFVSPYVRDEDLKTLQDVDDAVRDYTGDEYHFMDLEPYKYVDEFPDYLDYNWRY